MAAVRFAPGDICLIRNVTGVQKRLRGMECWILSPLRDIRGLMRHEIEVDGLVLPDGWMVAAIPEHLERLDPPWLKGSWDACAWKPKELVQ